MVIVYVLFLLLVFALLALDLGVLNRKVHVISVKEALGWSVFWITLALLFNVAIYFGFEHHWFGLGLDERFMLDGKKAALQFLTGYLVEKSLSVDNIFVIALIFSYFKISPLYQHRILFWGILGALVFRGVMIAVGVTLLHHFEWMTYVFGALLIFTAFKLFFSHDDKIEPERNIFYRLFAAVFPVSKQESNGRFLIMEGGQRKATVLLVALVIIEGTDIMFAIDSIPAIFAITQEPFIVFSSNIFAILGMRSLYFVLAGYLDKLRYLKVGLVVLLAFIGVKMLLVHFYKIPPLVSLGIIGSILAVSVLASLLGKPMKLPEELQGWQEDIEELALIGYRQAKRLVILVLGTTIVLLGIVLVFLPGPGLLVIIAGLGVLGTEFIWAQRWLREVREYWDRMLAKVFKKKRDSGK